MSSFKKHKYFEIKNQELYSYYYERLVNIALSQFEWEGLPDTCDRLYFERMLLTRGSAAIYLPEGTDFLLSTGFLPVSSTSYSIPKKDVTSYLDIDNQVIDQNGNPAPQSYDKYFTTTTNFNVYGYPVNIIGIGFNGEQIKPEENGWVMLYDNMSRQSLIGKIDLYARLLYEIHSTMRNNIRQQNTPYIILSTKNKSLSFKNIFRSVFNYEPVIELASSFDTNTIQTLDLKVDFKGKDLMELLQEVWREALNMLGISSQSTKKERLLTGEIQMDRQADILSLNARLLNRVEFCNKINKKFGLNLSVNLSSNNEMFDLEINEEDDEDVQ